MDWRREWQCFLLAVQFLTRLPTPRDLAYSDEASTRAARYYPLVGALVGLIGAVVLLATALVLPQSLAVLLSTGATILATGALHEDGLADCADGLGGGHTRERFLEIMRDSRIGTYGAVAMGLCIATKVVALAAMPVPLACILLITGHGISRMAPVFVIARYSYARAEGAKFTAPSVSARSHRIAWMTTLTLCLFLIAVIGALTAGVAFAVAALAAGAMTYLYHRRLTGYTGDCLGATQQMAELGLYLGALACLV